MRYAIIACFVLSANALQGQLQVLSVLPNPENLQTEFKISHSLGEPCIQQQDISPYFVTEGFQQGDVQVASSTDIHSMTGLISISPNPVADVFTIKWTHPLFTDLNLVVLGSDGIVIKKIQAVTNNSTIFIGNLIPGSYIIHGFDLTGNRVLQQAIVKI